MFALKTRQQVSLPPYKTYIIDTEYKNYIVNNT